MNSPKMSYDPQANALYLRFSENEIAETLELSESVYVDVDVDGVPVGLEVPDATDSLAKTLSSLPNAAALRDLMAPRAA